VCFERSGKRPDIGNVPKMAIQNTVHDNVLEAATGNILEDCFQNMGPT
jgi:hypothetical protein